MTEPVIPETGLVLVGYADLLELVTSEVQAARVQAARVVNTELVVLYWRIGTLIRQRRAEQGWGTKVGDRLAADLRAAFPGARRFSPRNLVYMQTFAGTPRVGPDHDACNGKLSAPGTGRVNGARPCSVTLFSPRSSPPTTLRQPGSS